MTDTATTNVASHVRALAKTHHVTAKRDGMSRMATAITRLSGDTVELDSIEKLLINLKKKGVLSKTEALALQGRYLREKRHPHKALNG